MYYDVIIIGAGAAGFSAAYHLADKKIDVAILEAKPDHGGRALTQYVSTYQKPVESGAEFIHGKCPLTLKLLKEAGIEFEKVDGKLWQHDDGVLREQEDLIEHGDIFLKKLKELEHDISVKDFLDTYFSDSKYEALKRSVIQFSEGYDAADISLASIFALREEWGDQEAEQFRVNGGYLKLFNFIIKHCEKSCVLCYSSIVTKIQWQPGLVKVTLSDGWIHTAEKVIITVPVKLIADQRITFDPELPEVLHAAGQIGFGNVIKIVLQFDQQFWKDADDMFFLFSQEQIPTWWTQVPDNVEMLTGWLAGPNADEFVNSSKHDILDAALSSLSTIFKIDVRPMLLDSEIYNWGADPYSAGGYSYTTVGDEVYKDVFRVPIANTIYFAGEAYETDSSTVEAALVSGKRAAESITSTP